MGNYNTKYKFRLMLQLQVQTSLHCRQTKPMYSLSANQRPKACSAPHMLPGFSIIRVGSNWLLHVAVLPYTVIGQVILVEPWLALDEYQKHKISTVAITELAFEAVKSSLNYLTILQSNRNLWKSFWGNNVFVNLPTGFWKSFIFRCLPIVADIVHFKPKHAYMTSA